MHYEKLLVETKFSPPRVGARHILRKQLLDHFRNTRQCTLSLVTGSAGFGKTVLLVQWRQELMKAGAQVAWLSLSHDDRQFPSFCAYLLATLRRLGIPVEDDVLLEGGHSNSMENVVAMVASGAAHIPNELYLIIDDYHHVEDPWAHKLMQKLLDHCPTNLHFIIVSRASPPLSLSRLRVLGQVAELGFVELPFNLDETRVFFEQNLTTVKLSADELRLIHDQTNGWPASLQLIAIMLRNRPSARAKLRSFLWRSTDLQAYLAEDVLAHLPQDLTRLLESISICRRFNAELAVYVTQNSDAAELIKRAEDENLLIYRVESGDDSPWHRLHPLFGEFLAHRLARQGQPVVEALHRRASRWFADHDFLVEAIRHANLGSDLDFAVNAIEQAAPATWTLAYISPMLRLLDRLPQETLFAHPRLFFLGCLTYSLTARPAEAERWIEQFRRSEAANNPSLASKVALAEAAIAVQRDDSQRAIDLLEPLRNVSLDNQFLSNVYLAALASSYASVGRYADARRLLDDNPIAVENLDNDTALVVEGMRALIPLMEGRVDEAARVGAIVLARAEVVCGRGSVSANLCASNLGNAYYELDRIDDAREVLANRTGILRSSTPEVMVRAALCHARLDHLQENAETALAFLELQAAHFHSLELERPRAYMLAEQTRILLGKGNHVRAEELVDKLNELAAVHQGGSGYMAEIPIIAAMARARLALINCNPDEALRALDIVRAFAGDYGRAPTMVMANLLAALAHAAREEDEATTKSLSEALRAGKRLGLIRTFVDEGATLGTLLESHRKAMELDAPTTRYLDELLGRFEHDNLPLQARNATAQRDPAAQRASLTPRELEILALISQAMSNKRIALTLNITLETVKWNVRNILAKIGVSSRYDAMTWARQQGLIE